MARHHLSHQTLVELDKSDTTGFLSIFTPTKLLDYPIQSYETGLISPLVIARHLIPAGALTLGGRTLNSIQSLQPDWFGESICARNRYDPGIAK